MPPKACATYTTLCAAVAVVLLRAQAMQRPQWSSYDYHVLEKLYTGYASKGEYAHMWAMCVCGGGVYPLLCSTGAQHKHVLEKHVGQRLPGSPLKPAEF